MKVFVLGLDGATFDCLNPLMEEGVIPNIKEICAKWSYGPLKTIFPPVTAPAWLALATGLNPGKTGVFDYINRAAADSDRMLPISSAYYEKRAVWDHLGKAGYKVGIFNYPTLSPPPAVNGFAVSGMGGQKGRMCCPATLEQELEEVTGGYENRLNLRSPKYKKNVDRFFEDIDCIISKQSTALKFLVREKEWDFFWAVFSFTDWIQHVLWKFIDRTHPLHDPMASKPVQKKYRDVWRRIDLIIGDLISLLPADSVFMIVSDHGAGPLDSVFYPNTWLHKKGWLKKRKMGWRSFVAERVRLFSDGSDNKYVRIIHQVLRDKVMRLSGSIDLIDLGGSLAYSPEHNTMFGCVSLTKLGKERNGFREELIEDIRRLPENVAGIREVEVILPEVIYSGPYVNLSPDIFFVINNYKTTVEVDLARDPFVNSPSIDMRTGGHQPDGVFMVRGYGIRQSRLKDLSVLDIAPTILALFGIDIPSQIDGKVIDACLKPDAVKSAGAAVSEEQGIGENRPIEETGDLDEMKKMLKSLGYM